MRMKSMCEGENWRQVFVGKVRGEGCAFRTLEGHENFEVLNLLLKFTLLCIFAGLQLFSPKLRAHTFIEHIYIYIQSKPSGRRLKKIIDLLLFLVPKHSGLCV